MAALTSGQAASCRLLSSLGSPHSASLQQLQIFSSCPEWCLRCPSNQLTRYSLVPSYLNSLYAKVQPIQKFHSRIRYSSVAQFTISALPARRFQHGASSTAFPARRFQHGASSTAFPARRFQHGVSSKSLCASAVSFLSMSPLYPTLAATAAPCGPCAGALSTVPPSR